MIDPAMLSLAALLLAADGTALSARADAASADAVRADGGDGGGDAAPDIVVQGLTPEGGEHVGGAFAILDRTALDRQQPITLKTALRRLPGVAVIDEDGFGYKLNISVRGLTARRSGRTLLLEDGAPIQPAPYADPSAHHFPPLNRIERIEVRTGSAQILHGPQSIGGVINFVTPGIPVGAEGGGELSFGERGFRRATASVSLGDDAAGLRIDATDVRGDGVRDFHRSVVDEIAAKARLRLGPANTLTLKAACYEEHSSITEGGLNQARYTISPYYNPFRNDRFDLDRVALQAVDSWSFAPRATLTVQAYYARTFRASYRQADTSVDQMTANAATGCVGAARIDYEGFAGRCGNKMRPRVFSLWGVEPRLSLEWSAAGVSSQTILGARAHFETTNRKRYNGLTPAAREESVGTLLRDDNDIDTDAYAVFFQNTFKVGRLSVTPGVRFERIETTNRARVAGFAPIDKVASSGQSIVLPGAGATWSPTLDLTVFAGIHRGFAPPRPDRDFNPTAPFNAVRPEFSVETEAGLRLNLRPSFSVSATVFQMNLSDLIVDGPLVGGRSGTFVNAGKARHRGIELVASGTQGPVYFGFTYTGLLEAKFLSDTDETIRGVRGNRIPYTPRHQIDAHVGLTSRIGAALELGVSHLSQQFANASNTRIASADGLQGLIPARTIFRMTAQYTIPRTRTRLFASAENLFDQSYIASRIDGLFAGPRRQIVAGVVTRL